MSQKQHDLYDKSLQANGHGGQGPNLDVAALQLDAVIDLPVPTPVQACSYISTRLYVESIVEFGSLANFPELVGRPLTDAFTMSTYLSTRYKVRDLQIQSQHS